MKTKPTISVIGLGYVGLPVAVALAAQYDVIGFDISEQRITELNKGYDRTEEIDSVILKTANLNFTGSEKELANATFHIIAVPTPIDAGRQPDLTPLIKASETVARQLKKNDIVVYESTVYPGATEEICVPVLEKLSGLSFNQDFAVGYSPERINPGDHEHRFESITKVVSGSTPEALNLIADVYGSVVKAGIHKAPAIKVAEAAKVIENTQRDINIAFMNELALIFEKMEINTKDVLAAANTKWNFLPFKPGLVGGHCIGVDPYYLTYQAQKYDYHPEVILSGRRINDAMGKHIAEMAIKRMIQLGMPIQQSKVGILGLTFKENCPDLRNAKVKDIIDELNDYGLDLLIHDPRADAHLVEVIYGQAMSELEQLSQLDVLILAVPHAEYLTLDITKLVKASGLIIDIKAILDKAKLKDKNINLWQL